MREPYTTVTRRRRRKTTDEGRTVTWVDETVTTASENERDVARKAYHARERGEFVKMIQAKLHRIAVECFGGVDPETGEIVAERRDAPAPVDQEGVEKVHESSETPKGLRRAATPSERMGQGDAREGAESAGTGTEGSEASVPVAEPLSGPDNPLGGHTADTPATHPPGSVGGDLSDLARALSRWLERNPQDHPDCHPPGDRRMMRSGIESTLWAHNLLPPGRRYSREEVAEALQLGESFGRKDVAA